MKLKEQYEKTGKLPTYHLENIIEELVQVNKNKPSSRIIRTKQGKTAIAGLIEIEKKHNTSWYQELKKRSKDCPNELALFYRGTKVSFSEMFTKADEVAQSLVEAGIKKGDEIPVCLSNTPELVYIMLAANKIGAKLNLFSSHLDKEYISEILDNCSLKLFIGTDDTYEEIKEIIESKPFENKVLISLADSLPKNPTLADEYEKELDHYYRYENKAVKYKEQNKSLMTFKEFIESGKNNTAVINDDNNLDTEFLITYTSGSTKNGRPKQLLHSNRSLITMGVFHDPELCGNPKIKGLRALAHIHSDSNTNLITSISDSLMQQWSVALEPEYDKDKALDYLFINKANQVSMTTSFWVQVAKQYLFEKKYHENGKGRKMPFLLAGLAVGEKTSKGEEKLINRFYREARAGSGVKLKGLSFPYTTIGIGGGDCEHGGIYYSLWHSLQEKLNYTRLNKRSYGMKPVPFAHVSAFKEQEDGTYKECDYDEYGLIAANSAVTMLGYKNNPTATTDLIIEDELGREWISSNVYGYIDNLGGVHVKGRIGGELTLADGMKVPQFLIEEIIEKDTKNILSCVITQTNDNELIINIELQPDKQTSQMKALLSAKKRAESMFPSLKDTDVYFRIFSNDESFPLTGSGKRNIRAIEELGLENTFKIATEKENEYELTSKKSKVYKK